MFVGPLTISVSVRAALAGLGTALLLMLAAPNSEARDLETYPAAIPRVEIVLLPNGVGIEWLDRVDGLSPGLLSAGMGRIIPDQTYLDISQGARAFNSLYDRPLPLVYPRGDEVPKWKEITERAASAPGSIRPGLFASTLNRELGRRFDLDEAVQIGPELVLPSLVAADLDGALTRKGELCPARDCRPPVLIRDVRLRELPRMVRELEGEDLLIAFERPPSDDARPLAIGIAGAGFEGSLTSDSTRTDGYVLTTDIAATVLERLEVERPNAMSGRPITGTGDRDAADLDSLAARMAEVAPRRGPVLAVSVLVWFFLAAFAVMFARTRALGLRLLAMSAVYAPLLLLFTAWLQPSLGLERLIVLVGSPGLAAATVYLLGPWRDLAAACALTTVAHLADLIAGSSLIPLSLIGPNPALGVRFFGVGNELGSTLTMLILLGIGAGLAGFAPTVDRRRAAAVFIVPATVAAFVLAAGGLGASVGTALVIPASAIVAAAIVLARPVLVALALVVPVFAVGALVALDALTGGNSHFQRTVLEAESPSDLFDTARRRLQLTGRSFVRASSGPFLPLAALVIGLAVAYRDRVREWVSAAPQGFAAAFGAGMFATVLGTLANDSGVLLLQVGTAYLLLMTGYAWSQRP